MELSFVEVIRRRRAVLDIPEDIQDGLNVVKLVIQAALEKLSLEWKEKLKSEVSMYPIPSTIRDQLLLLF